MYINDIKAHYGNNYLMLRHHLSSCKVNPKISRILVLNVILIFSFYGIIHGWRIAQAVNFPDTNIMFNSTKKIIGYCIYGIHCPLVSLCNNRFKIN